jgi:hypothetical protein
MTATPWSETRPQCWTRWEAPDLPAASVWFDGEWRADVYRGEPLTSGPFGSLDSAQRVVDAHLVAFGYALA